MERTNTDGYGLNRKARNYPFHRSNACYAATRFLLSWRYSAFSKVMWLAAFRASRASNVVLQGLPLSGLFDMLVRVSPDRYPLWQF